MDKQWGVPLLLSLCNWVPGSLVSTYGSHCVQQGYCSTRQDSFLSLTSGQKSHEFFYCSWFHKIINIPIHKYHKLFLSLILHFNIIWHDEV